MRREQRIRAKRSDGQWPALLALLLAAVLSMAPAVAAAAIAAPGMHESGMMEGPCSMPGDHPADVIMVCAMAGGCVVLPVAGPEPASVVRKHVVVAPPALAIRVGWNQAPEPPPPRPGSA